MRVVGLVLAAAVALAAGSGSRDAGRGARDAAGAARLAGGRVAFRAALIPGRRTAGGGLPQDANIPYNGRYTVTRIRYTANSRGYYEFFRDRLQVWEHDYPRAERHLAKIVSEVTSIEPVLDASEIFMADDAKLDEFPIAYLCEAGYWGPTDKEVVGLRNYLLKGGFIIFDDFRGGDWANFITQLHRVLPGIDPVPLDVSHPIFHSFFDIASLDFQAPTFRQYKPVFYGLFEKNDPKGRMLAIVNYNNDVSEYWEWSNTGFLPIDLSNEAYKLGINYIVYAMTH